MEDDPDGWNQNMSRIYGNLIDTVISNTVRSARSRLNAKAVTINSGLVNLAADVCFQIYSSAKTSDGNGRGSSAANITQIVGLETTQVSCTIYYF